MNYSKPWQSYQQQLNLLKSRGLVVSDEAKALEHLERIGYYRLSGYWYSFRVFALAVGQEPSIQKLNYTATDDFHPNTHFIDAVNLYVFDKRLRLLALDGLERIEIALRVDMAYLLGKRDIFAHRHIAHFHPTFAARIDARTGKTKHQLWLEKYDTLVIRSKEDFVKHHRQKYGIGSDFAIWEAVELLDFGALSQLFAMMRVKDKEHIALKYGVDDWRVFQSWLVSLNYLRNLSAHHSRLWNKNITDQPKLPTQGKIAFCDAFDGKADLTAKPFLLLCIVGHLLKIVCPATLWHQRIKEHMNSFPTIQSSRKLSVDDMGTVDNWQAMFQK